MRRRAQVARARAAAARARAVPLEEVRDVHVAVAPRVVERRAAPAGRRGSGRRGARRGGTWPPRAAPRTRRGGARCAGRVALVRVHPEREHEVAQLLDHARARRVAQPRRLGGGRRIGGGRLALRPRRARDPKELAPVGRVLGLVREVLEPARLLARPRRAPAHLVGELVGELDRLAQPVLDRLRIGRLRPTRTRPSWMRSRRAFNSDSPGAPRGIGVESARLPTAGPEVGHAARGRRSKQLAEISPPQPQGQKRLTKIAEIEAL